MTTARRHTVGKFLQYGNDRLLVKGVAYGTFAPAPDGTQFPPPAQVDCDFAAMARHGINTVRTYTPPTDALLDTAAGHGLHVMAGLPWEQHVAFLDDRAARRRIRRDVAAHVRRLASHPATLLVALGNEIPAAVVRWHGADRIERFLGELYEDSKAIWPDGLFTYVNFPPTEYLDLPFVDVVAFNVYLHRKSEMRAYVARLQRIAAYKPLLLAEAGADSIRQGEEGQAELTASQIQAAFAEGACGAVAFAWTDEWWRGGTLIEDWAFGLVDRARRPKAALSAVAQVFEAAPFPQVERNTWPRVSVVVCAYNAAETLEECLTSLEHLTYPDYEVILINDGSSDATEAIATRHPRVRHVSIRNGGLSAARNIGLEMATGDIVAYTDADVRVDHDWLTYLVQPFLTSGVVGVGGPNVVPPEDPWVAQCVARAPGGPTHVLLDDRVAEHVPGCNMAFRREALLAVGGFNPIYLRAGDDVDVCWRLQARGWTIGFSAAALVWHHHRPSIRQYWRQQVGYGEGLTWLMPHHPEKFVGGKVRWRGHIYSPLPFLRALSRPQVNTGVWGTAAFPSVYQSHAYPFAYWPHSVRWQVASLMLIGGGLVVRWFDAAVQVPLATVGLIGLLITVIRCVQYAMASRQIGAPPSPAGDGLPRAVATTALIAWLHFLQPMARAWGQIRGMLHTVKVFTPEERRSLKLYRPSPGEFLRAARLLLSGERSSRYWSEQWVSTEDLLTRLMRDVTHSPLGPLVEVDDGWQSSWDLRVRAGRSTWPGMLSLSVLVEHHAQGRCLVRIAERVNRRVLIWPIGAAIGLGAAADLLLSSAPATAGSVLAVLATLALSAWSLWSMARPVAAVDRAIAAATASFGITPLDVTPAASPDRHHTTHTAASVDPSPHADPTGTPRRSAGL